MPNSDQSEQEEEGNVFEVEEIIQVVIPDHGKPLYEIKWKGYSSECENTFEPESNLEGCEKMLKEFKEKHGIPPQRTQPSPSASILTKKKRKSKLKRKVSFVLTDNRASSSASQKAPTPDIFGADDDDVPIALLLKKGKGKEKTTENRQDRQKDASQHQSSSSSSSSTASAKPAQQNFQNEQRHRQPSKPTSTTPLSIQSNIPQKPSLFIHKDHTPSNPSTSSSSFTNLKRSSASKSALPVEIDRILSQFSGTLRQNTPTTPKPLQITRTAPAPVSVYHPPSANTTPPTTPTTQSPIRTNARMPDLTPQRQLPSQPPKAPPPQPQQRPATALPPNQPFHQQLSISIPIKRQTSGRPDPRLIAKERKKFKLNNNEPCRLEALLKKGNDPVCKVTLSGVADKVPQLGLIKHLLQLQNPQDGEVAINSFLPLKRFSDYLTAERTASFMSVVPVDQFIQAGKLRNFMSVNEITGVVCHAEMPTEALFIMAARDVSKVSNMPSDVGLENARLDQLFAIFVDNLPPRPRLNFQDVDYVDETDQLFSWRQMCRYLKFPAQLQHLYQTTSFLVYGHSESSIMLNRACMSLPPVTRKPTNLLVPHNIMMFDRFNNELLHKSLLKHKREPVTQIWEFGVPNFYYGDIEPACEVFPQHSGGFITTDAANIASNPHIIEGICSQIKRFKDMPVAFGEWKFVLPHNFLQSFKQLLKDGYNSVAIQEALIFLTIALSNGDIEIMRTWPEEKEEPNSIVFMKHVLREHYKTQQYFVYVDDMDAVDAKSKEIHVSIDFVTTDMIFRTFA